MSTRVLASKICAIGAWALTGNVYAETLTLGCKLITGVSGPLEIGYSSTGAYGINDAGEISGTSGNYGNPSTGCQSTAVAFRYIKKKLSSIQITANCFTLGQGINNNGTIVGRFLGNGNQGFTWDVNGSIVTYAYPNTPYLTFSGINDNNVIVGTAYNYQPGTGYGIIYQGGAWSIEYSAPSSSYTEFLGINNNGQVVGAYTDLSGHQHGLLLNGVVGVNLTGVAMVQIDVPNSTDTNASDVNNKGVIVGSFRDSLSIGHGFERKPDGKITQIDCDGATNTYIFGINDEGEIVGGLENGLGYFAFHAR